MNKETRLRIHNITAKVALKFGSEAKNGSTEHSKRNKTVPEMVAITSTEDGHKQTTKTSTTI